MNWDFLIGTLVIIGIVLIVWAKVSKQTVKDVILDIVDLFKGGGEEIEERAEEVIIQE